MYVITHIFVISILFLQSASSNAADVKTVTVTIDGQQYTCSQGSTSNSDCTQKASALTKKYEVCREGNASMTCFDKIFNTIDKTCTDASEACYNACVDSYASSTCFDKCY